MSDLAPKPLNTTLAFPDIILDLQDMLNDVDTPIYIVGGAVRDAYWRRPIKDVDLITSGSGLSLARRIANRMGGAFYALDTERHVGRALLDTPDGRVVVDVARFRGEDLRADLEDRDFTLNAIAVDLRDDLNLVIDPLVGIGDLQIKLLRRCSPQAITNDPLRALRAVRQSAQFGLRIEPETLRDIKNVGERLLDTSVERVRDEWFKILALPKPAAALRVMHSVGLLRVLLPEMAQVSAEQWQQLMTIIERMMDIYITISPARTDETAAQFSLGMLVMALDRFRPQLQEHTTHLWADERPHRTLLHLALLLLPFGAERTEAYATSLHLSNAEVERISAIVRHQEQFTKLPDLQPITIYRFWKVTKMAGVDVILVALARYLGETALELEQDDWLRWVERARVLLDAYYMERERLVEPPALVNGNDLMQQLGIPPGRRIGEILERIREAQVEGSITTPEAAVQFARSVLDAGDSR